MIKSTAKSQSLVINAENFVEVVEKIKIREIDLGEGQRLLEDFVKLPKVKSAFKLEAYYHLSRISY